METSATYGVNGMDAEGRSEELMRAVEALVFAADEPLTAGTIAELFAEITQEVPPSQEQIEEAVERLNAVYEAGGRALRIRRWAGGYRMSTTQEVAPYLKVYFQEDRRRRLSRSLMETLAILAYKQPATKPEIDFVRGVDSDYALRKLLETGLIDVLGRADSVGRPLLYRTTDRFLEAFGLEGLDDLPNLREIEALLNDPAFNREKARLLMVSGLDEQQPSDDDDAPSDEPEEDEHHGE
jgi:segregation and condensation protein B